MASSDGNGVRSKSVQAVERALDLLLLFSKEQPELRITEAAKQLGLSASTIHRLLMAFRSRGFVDQNPSNQRYRLGVALLQLGEATLSRLDLRPVARPFMEQLQRDTGETVNLNVLWSDKRVCIEKVESSASIRFSVDVGTPLPLLKGASGQALVAYMPDDYARRLYEVERDADRINDQFDLAAYLAELARVRMRGYAVSSSERVEGADSISAPVWDSSGRVVASLTVSGPSFRFTSAKVPEMIERLRNTAEKLSAAMGAPAESLQSS